MEDSNELILPLVDRENICLPLPINVVSRYWNVNLPIEEAARTAKRYQGFDGSVLIEGIEMAERHGLECMMVRSSVRELKRVIDLGIPPIVILPGIPEITHHASVITGYDEESILHYIQTGTAEGEQQEGAIPRGVFEQEWSEDGRLLILLAPPDVLSGARPENESGSRSNRLCLEAERQSILGDRAGAVTSLKEAARQDPDNPTAQQMLGGMMNEQNLPECVKFYQRCLEINDRAYLACNGLGNYYLKTKQFGKAGSYYTKAIGINPKRSARIYKNRAYLMQQQGDGPKARDDLKRYLRHLPRAPDRGVIEQAIREL